MVLKCLGSKKWGEQFLSKKWRNVNEEAEYRRISNCTNVVELSHVGNICLRLEVNGRIKLVICKWKRASKSGCAVTGINTAE
jgi:hypothetical protein